MKSRISKDWLMTLILYNISDACNCVSARFYGKIEYSLITIEA